MRGLPLLLAFAVATPLPGLARDVDTGPFIPKEQPSRYSGDEEKKLQEDGLVLPPYPVDKDRWIRFETTATTKNRFYLDRDALAVGEDGVVRYALIIESPSGVRNISFEGMRCKTAELKQYAWGGSDGKWFVNKAAEWKPMVVDRLHGHYTTLYERYLCNSDIARISVDNIIRLLEAKDSRDNRTPASMSPTRIFTQ